MISLKQRLFFILLAISILSLADDQNYQVGNFQGDALANTIQTVGISGFSFSSYTSEDRIFFVVKFPDEIERRSHKSWLWDPIRQHYREDDDFETAFSLTIESDDAKFADIWVWRSFMSDPVGMAEDMHSFRKGDEAAKSYTIILRDSGETCWTSRYFGEFAGERIPRFQHRKANGLTARGQCRFQENWIPETATTCASRKAGSSGSI